MLYDKVGNDMNENEMNIYNVGNDQSKNPTVPIDPTSQNTGFSVEQPNNFNREIIEGQPVNNFMEDFSQAVVTKSEPEVASTTIPTDILETVAGGPKVELPTTQVVNSNQSESSIEIPIEPQPILTEPQMNANSEVQSSPNEAMNIGKGKKGNWVFIIILFTIAGFFVLLLPLLVRIFGY